MDAPPIGLMGKVSKKAPIKHMPKPLLPIKANPAFCITRNSPAKAKVTKMPIHDSMKPKRDVMFLEW